MGSEGQDVRAEGQGSGEQAGGGEAARATAEAETTTRSEWGFEGVASSTALDRQGERLTAEALADVAAEGELALVAAHQARPEVVGTIERCEVDGGLLRVRGRLRDDEPAAARLRERLERGERLGLSLGGKVTRAHWGWDRESEGPVRHLDEVAVAHVAVCEPAAAMNPDVWVGLTVTLNAER